MDKLGVVLYSVSFSSRKTFLLVVEHLRIYMTGCYMSVIEYKIGETIPIGKQVNLVEFQANVCPDIL